MKNILHLSIIYSISVLPLLSFAQWNQVGEGINGNVSGDEFGNSVAISSKGDVLIASSMEHDFKRGQVHVFEFIRDEWVQIGLGFNGTSPGEYLGHSVDISSNGKTIAIGASQINTLNSLPGYVSIYQKDSIVWAQKGQNIVGPIDGQKRGEGSAISLSSDGNVVAIGAPRSSILAPMGGKVSVHRWNGTSWVQMGLDINGSTALGKLGTSVSLNATGDILIIGGPNVGVGGACTVYYWDGSNWFPKGTSILGLADNNLGTKVHCDTSGNVIAVCGRTKKLYGSGFVSIYSWDGQNWLQKGDTILGSQTISDYVGNVKLSADGNVLIQSKNGTNSTLEKVAVYRYNDSSWDLIYDEIEANGFGEFFGWDIDINSTGSKIVVSSKKRSSNGANSGQVEVFEDGVIANLNPLSLKVGLLVYPNPSKDYVNLVCDARIDAFELMSIEGRIIVSNQNVAENKVTIDVANLVAGVYILKASVANKVQFVKLVKE